MRNIKSLGKGDNKKDVIRMNKSISKKSIGRSLIRYESNDQGAQGHNVSIKIKDIDDKTKNFLNQIFSSAKATPSKTKKITLINTKQLQKKIK